MKSEVKKFYKEVNVLFPVHGKKEKVYLRDLKKQIEESDVGTYKELENDFGTPMSIVKDYYDTLNSDYIIAEVKKKRMILIFLFCIAVCAVVTSLYKMYTYQKSYEEFYNSIPVEVEETIVEE